MLVKPWVIFDSSARAVVVPTEMTRPPFFLVSWMALRVCSGMSIHSSCMT